MENSKWNWCDVNGKWRYVQNLHITIAMVNGKKVNGIYRYVKNLRIRGAHLIALVNGKRYVVNGKWMHVQSLRIRIATNSYKRPSTWQAWGKTSRQKESDFHSNFFCKWNHIHCLHKDPHILKPILIHCKATNKTAKAENRHGKKVWHFECVHLQSVRKKTF